MSASISAMAKKFNLKKVNGRKALTIVLSRDDISSADQKNPQNCAFACAVKRNDPAIVAAYFFRSVAWLQYRNRLVKYRVPATVSQEILAFDRNKGTEPGVYQILPPTLSKRVSAWKKYAPNPARGRHDIPKTKRRVKFKTRNVRNSFAFVPGIR